MRPPSRPGFARVPDVAAPGHVAQRAGADRVFAATSRVLRAPPPPTAAAEELLPGPGGGFHVRSAQRQTLTSPTGTFNFVRVHGETPNSRPVLVSSRLPHAQIAAGRPVVYAGTARFEAGEMAWWSNYSGTYQPIAAFRAQAGLPDEKFVPWQKLQMGGTAMQRATFMERRKADPIPVVLSSAGMKEAERARAGAKPRLANVVSTGDDGQKRPKNCRGREAQRSTP